MKAKQEKRSQENLKRIAISSQHGFLNLHMELNKSCLIYYFGPWGGTDRSSAWSRDSCHYLSVGATREETWAWCVGWRGVMEGDTPEASRSFEAGKRSWALSRQKTPLVMPSSELPAAVLVGWAPRGSRQPVINASFSTNSFICTS